VESNGSLLPGYFETCELTVMTGTALDIPSTLNWVGD